MGIWSANLNNGGSKMKDIGSKSHYSKYIKYQDVWTTIDPTLKGLKQPLALTCCNKKPENKLLRK
jgi:hypothetical protein